MAWRSAAACHGASRISLYGAGVGSLFCRRRGERNQSDDQWAVVHSQCTAEWCLVKMYLWVGGSGASGSGEREQDAGRRLSVSHGTRARSYWSLVLTKPKSGEHGARGASWRDKSPVFFTWKEREARRRACRKWCDSPRQEERCSKQHAPTFSQQSVGGPRQRLKTG